MAADEGTPGGDTRALRDAQAAVDASVRALGGYWPPLANLARLFEECGELARAVNQRAGYKRRKPGETETVADTELGDALYTLLALATSLDVDAAAALDGALRRSRARTVSAPPIPQEEP